MDQFTTRIEPVSPIDAETTEGGDGPRTRTGIRVRQLVKDVEADLTDIESMLDRARAHLRRLEAEARGINGLSAACRGWGQQLDKMIADLDEERQQVERTMLGKQHGIVASVNGELREKIRIARQA